MGGKDREYNQRNVVWNEAEIANIEECDEIDGVCLRTSMYRANDARYWDWWQSKAAGQLPKVGDETIGTNGGRSEDSTGSEDYHMEMKLLGPLEEGVRIPQGVTIATGKN